jgi:hypothetical protein
MAPATLPCCPLTLLCPIARTTLPLASRVEEPLPPKPRCSLPHSRPDREPARVLQHGHSPPQETRHLSLPNPHNLFSMSLSRVLTIVQTKPLPRAARSTQHAARRICNAAAVVRHLRHYSQMAVALGPALQVTFRSPRLVWSASTSLQMSMFTCRGPTTVIVLS